MKHILTLIVAASIAAFASCDAQSGITKKSLEEYQPTPTITPMPTEAPIDPADVVTVDTSVQGDTIQVNGPNEKQTVTCTKFNRVMVNSTGNVVTVKGACKQIMINGSGNEVTADATAEIVVNGGENTVRYARFANGKRPIVTETRPGNTIEKIPAPAAKK